MEGSVTIHICDHAVEYVVNDQERVSLRIEGALLIATAHDSGRDYILGEVQLDNVKRDEQSRITMAGVRP